MCITTINATFWANVPEGKRYQLTIISVFYTKIPTQNRLCVQFELSYKAVIHDYIHYIGYQKYMQMGTGEKCPKGMDIGTKQECEDALEWAMDLGIRGWHTRFKDVKEGNWNNVPYRCSYQAGGSLDFHWNKQNNDDVPEFNNGDYKMLCKKGSEAKNYEIDLKIF